MRIRYTFFFLFSLFSLLAWNDGLFFDNSLSVGENCNPNLKKITDNFEDLDESTKSKANAENRTFVTYHADIAQGLIGVNECSPSDNPEDNVFHIYLDERPLSQNSYWLSYELKGVQDHTAISRSINERQAVGGYLVKKSENWKLQKEEIRNSWLKQGKNTIQFSIPADAQYHYFVKNLQLIVEQKSSTSVHSNPEIIVNQPSQTYYDNQVYIKGFIKGKVPEGTKLFVNQKMTSLFDGEFETIVQKGTEEESWKVEVQLIFPDGSTMKKYLNYYQEQSGILVNAYSNKGLSKKKKVNPNLGGTIALAGASIQIPGEALKNETTISITALRPIDIVAMNSDMVNVTNGQGGYRFLPHGTQFCKPIALQLDYDPQLIPDGYTAKDIRTFFFDENARRWTALPYDSLNEEQTKVFSQTTHFTDFINGIIKIPESPETQGYKPTSIKDIKAANPSAGIVIIEPPTANNTGTANLNFLIKIPDGRNGMQPQLAIGYNSDGGNGWLGEGWTLNIPAVSIETRWGVPRFDPDKETETYTLNGMQLWPVTHRSELVDRNTSGDKQFYPRVEGAFDKIIRHGNSPSEYWWEVTNKEGVKTCYGGLPGMGVLENAVLRDTAGGNISYWSIVETRDLNNNYIRYHCVIQNDIGVDSGSVDGQQLYIDHITYTGHDSTEGAYEIWFYRDRQEDGTNWQRRIDVQISGRLGFKQVTADLLKRIEVRLGDAAIRNYQLEYTTGAFYKTLLSSISEIDKNGQEFYTHSFEYYDDVRVDGTYVPFKNAENWSVDDDEVEGEIILPIFDNETSVISGSKSTNVGGGLALTVGPNGSAIHKKFTIGGNFSYSSSNSNGLISLIDIDGDGLPDKVFQDGNGLVYRKNLTNPQNTISGFSGGSTPLDISGIDIFSRSKTSSTNVGVEAHPSPLFVGYTNGRSKTTTDAYFTDFNGDGLIDIAKNGKVFFNRIDPSNGLPNFTIDSELTPSRIIAGNSIAGDIIQIDPNEQAQLAQEYPLHDVVRMWVAPCSGDIVVKSNTITLDTTGTQEYAMADGIRASIQHEGNSPLWFGSVSPPDANLAQPDITISGVSKGDKIFFRLQSIKDGAFDQVHWDPVIEYLNFDVNEEDANGKKLYRYQASEDFLLSSSQRIFCPYNGEVNIEGDFTKPVTSDNVTIQILQNNTFLVNETINWDNSNTVSLGSLLTNPISVSELDSFEFRVSSNTNVCWPAISWTPVMSYMSATDTIGGNPDSTIVVVDANGDPLINYCPTVEYTMYNEVHNKPETITSSPTMTINTPNLNMDPGVTGTITISVKGENVHYGESTINFNGGVIIPSVTIPGPPSGGNVFVEYHMGEYLLAEAIAEALGTNSQYGVYSGILEEDKKFGTLYRGWGQFIINGNGNISTPIAVNDLELPDITGVSVPGINDPDDIPAGFDSIYFNVMVADVKSGAWVGCDPLTYITGDTMSSSRLGEDNIMPDTTTGAVNPVPGTSCLGAPMKITKSKTNGLSGSLAFISGGRSRSTMRTVLDVMDFNGDRYPDVVSEDKIQPTNSRGGLEEDLYDHDQDSHISKSHAITLGFNSGGFPNAKSDNTGELGKGTPSKSTNAKANANLGNSNSGNAQKTSSASLSVSGNFGSNDDETECSWMDINADGLPDKVFKNGDVALNVGYKFETAENWNFPSIRKGNGTDVGGGLGVSLFNGSIQAGIGTTRTDNETMQALQDVNGDGLLDIVSLDCPFLPGIDTTTTIDTIFSLDDVQCTVGVQFNTGNGFSPEVFEWTGYHAIDEGS